MFNKEEIAKTIADSAGEYFDMALAPEFETRPEEIQKAFKDAGLTDGKAIESVEEAQKLLREKAKEAALNDLAKNQLLGTLDMLWMTNLEDLEALQESVGLRAYGQRDPLVEYRQEASRLFKSFWANFNGLVFANTFKLIGNAGSAGGGMNPNAQAIRASGGGSAGLKIGRNDPCPCGSGKKWKKCGLLNTEEHQRNIAKKSGAKHEVTGG
jgi:preprotein translocase subunit SecA